MKHPSSHFLKRSGWNKCVCVWGGGKRLYIQLRSLLLLRENTFLRHDTFLSKEMTDASLAKAATLPTSIHLKITF